MKISISLFIAVFFLYAEGYSQKTPAEFGTTAFWCFQHNRLDSLMKLVPSMQDLSGFAKSLGITEGSESYKSFMNRYPLVIKSFRDKCYQVQRDSLEFQFSWVNARLEKVEPVERTIIPENVPNKKPVPMTMVNIYFTSRGQSWLLKFGDLHAYGGYWKTGNNLSLTIQFK